MKATSRWHPCLRAPRAWPRRGVRALPAAALAMVALGLGTPAPSPAATVTLQHGVTPRVGGGTYVGTADSWVNEGVRGDNYGASHELRVKCDLNDQGYAEDHTLIKFELPGLSFGSVRDATMELFYFEAESFQADNALGIKPWRIDPTKGWFENDGGPGGKSGEGVNFRYRDQSQTQEWTGQYGGWYDKIDDGNGTNLIKRAGGTVPGAIEPGNWVPFNVRPSVGQWYSGATNHGLFLFSSAFIGSGTVCWGKFASRDTNNLALRPKLTLGYENAAISWTGTTNGNWDTNTGNWNVGGYVGRFEAGDGVTFADGASNPSITVAGAGVSPGSVTISNSSTTYSFSGGSIGGSGGLTKRGAGQATLAAPNTYTGPTLIQAGRLIVSANNALGTTAAGTAVSNGAALGLHNVNYAAAEPLSLMGTGVGGSGALYAVSGNSTFGGPVTLTGDTLIGVGSGLGLTLSHGVGGGFALTKSGAGTLTLGGAVPNTYGGATYVNQGTLALAKSTGPAVPGALWIGEGSVPATVRLDNSDQLAATSDVTVRAGSQLDLNNYNCSLRNLALSNATVLTGTGLLTLGGSVSSSGDQTNQISGKLDLSGATRVVTVADGAATDDLVISASLANGGLHKAGAGRLVLSGSSTYAGGTVVAEGILTAANSGALGAPAGNTVVSNNARLELRGDVAMGTRPLRVHGHGGGPGALSSVAGINSWSGPVRLGMTATIGAESGAALALNGVVDAAGQALYFSGGGAITLNNAVIGGPGSTVIKFGPGTLTFGGLQPNTYAGSTLVWQGQLLLANAGGPAIPGDLTIGDALTGDAAAVVCGAANQFEAGCRATVNRNGLLDLNGHDAALSALTLNGGAVQTGTGTLGLFGPLTSMGDTDAWVLGNLRVDGSQPFHVRGSGTLYLGAHVTGGQFTKWGWGPLVFTNVNAFDAECVIAGGPVIVNNDPQRGYGLGPAAVLVETAPILGNLEAMLSGSGSVSGPVTVRNYGVLSPGTGVGTLVISNHLRLEPRGVLRIETGPLLTQPIDVLDLQLGGDLQISDEAVLQLEGTLRRDHNSLVFIKRARAVTGHFQGLPSGAPVPEQPGWFIHYGKQRVYFSQVAQPSLVYFRAFSTNGVVVVGWRTALELETTGFDLFRWEEGEGWIKVNPKPILPQNPAGAAYTLVDPGAQPDFSYRYRLDEYASGGTESYEYERTPTEFAFSAPPEIVAGAVTLRWFSRVDETYDLLNTFDLNDPLVVMYTNLVATPPENVLRLPAGLPVPLAHFFRLRMVE